MDDSMSELDKVNYARGIGAFKPHFEGISESYYPLKCS